MKHSLAAVLLVACTSARAPVPPTPPASAGLTDAAPPASSTQSDDSTEPVVTLSEAEFARAPPADSFPVLGPTNDPPMGTVAPSLLWQFAPDGHWAVICEARRDTNGDGRIEIGLTQHGEVLGDAVEPYLVFGSGAGTSIDDFVASTSDGRWLAFVRKGRLVLRDTAAGGRDEDLSARGADSSTDNAPLFRHRAGSFDEAGQRFQYLRRGPEGTSIIVRELATGGESAISVGRDHVDRSFFVGDGRWVIARLVPYEGSRASVPDPARPITSLGERRCRGQAMSSSVSGRTSGDRTVTRIARLGRDTALVTSSGELVTALGARLLLRRKDEALIVLDEANNLREWVPASCRGRVVAVASTLDRALVGCTANGDRNAPAEIAGDSGRRPLGFTIAASEDYLFVGRKISIPQFASDPEPARILDFQTGEAKREPYPASRRLAVTGHQELITVARGEHVALVLRDRSTGVTRPLARAPSHGVGQFFSAGSAVVWARLLVDVAGGRVVGRSEAHPQIVLPDGRMFVRFGDPPSVRSDMSPRQFRWIGGLAWAASTRDAGP